MKIYYDDPFVVVAGVFVVLVIGFLLPLGVDAAFNGMCESSCGCAQ